jgi:streptogramin lyase
MASRWAVRVVVGVIACAGLVAAGSLVPGDRTSAGSVVSVTDYSMPGTDPWGTAFDPSGEVWLALPGCDPLVDCPPTPFPGKLVLFDPKVHQVARTVSLPIGFGQPLFVAVGHDGTVWFTMPLGNAIGAYNPARGSVAQWIVPTRAAEPWDLAIDSNGTIWFTEHGVNKIAAFDPATKSFQEVTTPTAGSYPYGITVDQYGNVWFTENPSTVAQIGEYTRRGQVLEFKIRRSGASTTFLTPHLITTDDVGNPWWSEGFAEGIGKLDRQQARPGTDHGVIEYLYGVPDSGHTSGIAYHNGRIWFDDAGRNTIGSLDVAGGTFTFYKSPSSHPHDGLNIDDEGHIWFDEEFSSNLAETTSNGYV